MGMYTELNIGVQFKSELPEDIFKALEYMVKNDDSKSIDFSLEHPLFSTERWKWMLRSGGSYYFDAKPVLLWEFDEISKAWYLTLITNIKNYSDEWENFLNFIAPHLESSGYIGTLRYEESDQPTLLFCEGGEIKFKEPKP
jgi:hypothetical protein